ncbi:hypothetical protein EDEG_03220 [Edhazardia aedis USNM 41457]|uniref:Uncharacterized protein n=1 Tax=Edhazardia aedis (strain USNM 41457) TaxID=1003232 RepID=J9D3D7_EDHAE|nr:hypothetical protein EDEG_03220 [Edhazardia aedis USNM 41457]|eukprot:EJW02361.1 hypothetical protein EDEG_03220 [Edhazardia aedis USNM 41457]
MKKSSRLIMKYAFIILFNFLDIRPTAHNLTITAFADKTPNPEKTQDAQNHKICKNKIDSINKCNILKNSENELDMSNMFERLMYLVKAKEENNFSVLFQGICWILSLVEDLDTSLLKNVSMMTSHDLSTFFDFLENIERLHCNSDYLYDFNKIDSLNTNYNIYETSRLEEIAIKNFSPHDWFKELLFKKINEMKHVIAIEFVKKQNESFSNQHTVKNYDLIPLKSKGCHSSESIKNVDIICWLFYINYLFEDLPLELGYLNIVNNGSASQKIAQKPANHPRNGIFVHTLDHTKFLNIDKKIVYQGYWNTANYLCIKRWYCENQCIGETNNQDYACFVTINKTNILHSGEKQDHVDAFYKPFVSLTNLLNEVLKKDKYVHSKKIKAQKWYKKLYNLIKKIFNLIDDRIQEKKKTKIFARRQLFYNIETYTVPTNNFDAILNDYFNIYKNQIADLCAIIKDEKIKKTCIKQFLFGTDFDEKGYLLSKNQTIKFDSTYMFVFSLGKQLLKNFNNKIELKDTRCNIYCTLKKFENLYDDKFIVSNSKSWIKVNINKAMHWFSAFRNPFLVNLFRKCKFVNENVIKNNNFCYNNYKKKSCSFEEMIKIKTVETFVVFFDNIEITLADLKILLLNREYLTSSEIAFSLGFEIKSKCFANPDFKKVVFDLESILTDCGIEIPDGLKDKNDQFMYDDPIQISSSSSDISDKIVIFKKYFTDKSANPTIVRNALALNAYPKSRLYKELLDMYEMRLGEIFKIYINFKRFERYFRAKYYLMKFETSNSKRNEIAWVLMYD